MRDSPLILFVCTGNICRSPMAEYLLRDALPPRCPWSVASAGTHAVDGFPASRPGVEVLQEEGIDMRPHRSRPLTAARLRAADVVCVMTRMHKSEILAFSPDMAERVFLLGEFDSDAGDPEIGDPIGASAAVYRAVRDRIKSALPGLLDFMRDFALEG